jgi:hypothetical protein
MAIFRLSNCAPFVKTEMRSSLNWRLFAVSQRLCWTVITHYHMRTQADGSGDIRRLLHEQVPELANGIVEIKAFARERGQRSALAVYSTDRSVDPVGTSMLFAGRSQSRTLFGMSWLLSWFDTLHSMPQLTGQPSHLIPAVRTSLSLIQCG